MRTFPGNHEPPRATLAGVALAIALLLVGNSAAEEESTWRPVRLRVSLESPEPAAWSGTLSVSGGRLEALSPLSRDAEVSAGAALIDGAVRLSRARPINRDVLDVTARCPPGAELALRVGEAVATVAVDAARDAPQGASSADGSLRLAVERPAEDRMRITTDRETLLFAPGEAFAFEALVEPAGVERGEPIDFIATLSRGRAGPTVWRSEPTRVEATGVATVRIPLLTEEGVYRVTLTASRPSGFFSRFARLPQGAPTTPLIERSFLVAVFDPAVPPAAPGAWTEAYTFDPRSHRWGDRIPKWMKWTAQPWLARGPISSDGRSDAQATRDGAVEVALPASDGVAHWRAYPIAIDEPGANYAAEVEQLGEAGAAITIAVLEPDALGDLRPLGVAVTQPAPRWNRAQPEPVRVSFRPRTSSPLLIVSNPVADRPARFGRIRLLKSTGVARTPVAAERLVALDWADADLPHAVGASHSRTPDGRFEVPDLATWIETAATLADRVELAGANAAVVSVNAQGGAIYPSQAWPNPRLDLAAWYDAADDLPRREGLRVLVREFERRGLRIVPAVRLDGPTPWGTTSSARERILREAVAAAGPSPAVAAVAVRVSTGGWELLPPDRSTAADGDSLAAEYASLAGSIGLGTERLPGLVMLPAEAAAWDTPAESLTPRLGEATPPAATLVRLSGLEAISAAGVAVARPLALAPFEFPAGAESHPVRIGALRRALPAGSPVASTDAQPLPLRLIDSSRLLREGQNAVGDVVLRAAVAEPTIEPGLIAQSLLNGATIVVLGGPARCGLLDEGLAASRQTFAALPSGPAAASDAPTTDADHRSFDTPAGQSVAVVANRSPWPRRLRVTIDAPDRCQGTPLVADAPTEWFERGRHAVSVELAPHGVWAHRFSMAGVRIDGVRLEPSAPAQRELAEGLADLQSRDTTRRRAVGPVSNPSFEEAADGGGLVGWTLGPGATRDATVAIDGNASVRLRGGGADEASVTSDPFPAASSGQLVIEARLRVDRMTPTADLRIVLEQVDGPYRRETKLSGERLAAAQPGDWLPPVVFPNDDLPLAAGTRLRLRLTLTGDAEAHLDALRTEDLVLPLDGVAGVDQRAERLALVRLTSTAEAALAEGRLEACRELLDSYWARFLLRNFPATQPAPVVAGEPDAAEPAGQPAEGTPTLGERVRGYLPRWWR